MLTIKLWKDTFPLDFLLFPIEVIAFVIYKVLG